MKEIFTSLLFWLYMALSTIILIASQFAFYWVFVPCDTSIKILAISIYPLCLIIAVTQNKTLNYFDKKIDKL